MSDFIYFGRRIKDILGLTTEAVGVFFLKPSFDKSVFSQYVRVKKHRYCQALMRARRGEKVVLTKDEIACPAAARVFGFAELPPNLAKGEGLVGFGIVKESAAGKEMFKGMPSFEKGEIDSIAFCPLQDAPYLPDVVVIEAEVEKLMWLVLADVNLSGGRRRNGNTAVLQATCVDATLIPYKEKRLNFSFGCYGCREATDIKETEAVVGFYGQMLDDLVKMLEYLSLKAIPRSRSKGVYKGLMKELNSK